MTKRRIYLYCTSERDCTLVNGLRWPCLGCPSLHVEVASAPLRPVGKPGDAWKPTMGTVS